MPWHTLTNSCAIIIVLFPSQNIYNKTKINIPLGCSLEMFNPWENANSLPWLFTLAIVFSAPFRNGTSGGGRMTDRLRREFQTFIVALRYDLIWVQKVLVAYLFSKALPHIP